MRFVQLLSQVYARLVRGQVDHARALTAMSLAALEQMAVDDGKWDVAWLLTHQPQPAFNLHAMKKSEGPIQEYARLIDPDRVIAAIAHLKDLDAVAKFRKA